MERLKKQSKPNSSSLTLTIVKSKVFKSSIPSAYLEISRAFRYGDVGSLASNRILSPSTWVHFQREPFDLIVQ